MQVWYWYTITSTRFRKVNYYPPNSLFSLLGLKPNEREQVQDEWMRGVVPVITATISFGMGVDKASVR
jgi:ATP-dependent DNA helicase Q5